MNMFKIQNKQILGLFIILLSLVLIGCAPKRVARVDSSTVTDLSGRWNDTDSRLVSKEMIQDALSRPWLGEFKEKNKQKPKVIVGKVFNKSHEHINIETITQDLERALLNSGMVKFVATREERQELREERDDQAAHAGSGGISIKGEAVADFMVKGSIKTIVDELDGTKVVFYQVDLILIDIQTNDKVWMGQKKIKKIIERSGSKW